MTSSVMPYEALTLQLQRIRDERDSSEGNDFIRSRKAAHAWALSASYKEIEKVVQLRERIEAMRKFEKNLHDPEAAHREELVEIVMGLDCLTSHYEVASEHEARFKSLFKTEHFYGLRTYGFIEGAHDIYKLL